MIKIRICYIKYLRKPANSTLRLRLVIMVLHFRCFTVADNKALSISIILCRVSCYVRQARAVFFIILKDLAFLVRSRKYIVLYLNYSFCEFISAITVVKNSSFSKI